MCDLDIYLATSVCIQVEGDCTDQWSSSKVSTLPALPSEMTQDQKSPELGPLPSDLRNNSTSVDLHFLIYKHQDTELCGL